MKIGLHVSAAGGVQNAPENAHARGAEVFQFFDRSPRGGKPTVTPESIKQFKANCAKFGFREYYTHGPYYINLASSDNRIRYGSISVIREELELGSLLGVKYLMFHLGSAKDVGDKQALNMCIEGLDKIMAGYKGSTELLLEISAGAGQIIGDTFEEMAYILKKTKNKRIGICFDTCHAFVSGYDLRTKAAITKTFNKFESIIGLEKLKLFHINDSMTDFASHRDRHDNIGSGKIGKLGFQSFVNHPKIKNVNAVLETPDVDEKVCKSLEVLKKFRDK